MENRFCKKCLLDYSDESMANTISEYLESIPEDIRTDDLMYKQRIGHCANCKDNINGICRVCGCFVEIRAIKKNNYCPSTKKHW